MKAQSSTNILDVAPRQGVAGVSTESCKCSDEAVHGPQVGRSTDSIISPAPSHFSQSVDHFSELVAKKLAEYQRDDGDPGDENEERDAAEEGALIEASGYPDPANDPRWA